MRRILLRKLSEKVTINECELLKSLGTFKNMKYEFSDYPQTSFVLDFKFISSLERRSVFFQKKNTISANILNVRNDILKILYYQSGTNNFNSIMIATVL